VLVIDDNREAADSLCFLLRAWGFDAHTAYGGDDGLRAAQQCHPDVIICDLAMPQVSGFEVARRLRSGSALADVFLVALTGFGGAEFRARAAEAGFDRYLVKPAEPEVLRSLLVSSPHAAVAHDGWTADHR
jgi:CheY-like chemotaxis protein